jgi:hypothetical protein
MRDPLLYIAGERRALDFLRHVADGTAAPEGILQNVLHIATEAELAGFLRTIQKQLEREYRAGAQQATRLLTSVKDSELCWGPV